MNKVYSVEYQMYPWSETKDITVLAHNKAEAYDKANYEIIPEIEPFSPYAVWVASITYNNGNYKRFNTFAGNPY